MDDIHFDFMKAKGTKATLVVRQMLEKFRVKGKKLYFGRVDLEKRWNSVTSVATNGVHFYLCCSSFTLPLSLVYNQLVIVMFL